MPAPVLELAALTKEFGSGDSTLHVLHGLDCLISQGELVGIVGASGSGKTTLLNILGCLDLPTRGKYFLDEKLRAVMGDFRQRHRIRDRERQ